MSNHHFDNNEPTPPEPFVLDIANPDEAWPRFKRYMGFAGQIAELQTRMAELEASIVELKEQIAQARGFRLIQGSKRFEPAPDPIDCQRDYGMGDDEQC